MMWCTANGKTRQGGIELNFPSEATDELEVELIGTTLDDLLEELRRQGGKTH